jgi:beta-N-acetylhexosaminidase
VSVPSAVILGCAGLELEASERRFFRDLDPFGFILFARNIDNPDQVRSLVADLRDSVGRGDAPVLIDQEGGRVARLRPPHWKARPPARVFGAMHERDPDLAKRAIRLNYALIGMELATLGIDVDCAPVLDVPVPGAHDIIGDRACHETAEVIASLGAEVCEGLGQAGVMPVVKHIPGHGRALADSHLDLPRVDASAEDLAASDFLPFQKLSGAPWGMTAHIVYRALDADHPATLSPAVVGEHIRGRIGFDGLLLTDDLSMKALSGSFSDRASASLSAGCDVVLHCNGDMGEMQAVAEGLREMDAQALRRADNARSWLSARREKLDVEAGEAELDGILGKFPPA